MRTLVIGDIHGSLRGLKQCIERCNYQPQQDKIIFLGDYVDGWSESAELIQYLIELEEAASEECKPIFIKGNHDDWAKDWILMGEAKDVWLLHGGQATYDSYIRTGYLVKENHRKFFRNLKTYYIDDENRGFVHGGFTSRKGLGHDPYESNYYWDRGLWSLALLQDGKKEFLPNLQKESPSGSRYNRHKEIFIGHTATENWNYKYNGVLRIKDTTNPECKVGKPITTPIQACNVWNMDTGAGFNGKLTIMDINTKEYWQSDLSKDLYPDEKGR